MSKEYAFYRKIYSIADVLFRFLFRIKIVGAENIPDKPFLVCANHSSWCDPIFVALALSKNNHVHFMAKIELFKTKILNVLLTKLGAFGVDRKKSDITAIKKTLYYLKHNEIVCIFPEGTRKSKDNMVTPKEGAIHLADRANVEILPVFIPRKKRLFSRIRVVIGKPYKVYKEGLKLTSSESEMQTLELMNKIHSLNGVISK